MIRQTQARKLLIAALAGGSAIAAAGAATMATAQSQSDNASMTYRASLGALNNSGATGTATIRVSANGKNALVRITATGLEAGGAHLSHIHAVDSGDSRCPTLAQDVDGDGFVELAEGLQTYGPIRVDFMNIDPDQDGKVDFQANIKLDGSGLSDLTQAHIVVHGRSTTAQDGANPTGPELAPNEVDGTAGYKVLLPVLCGEIESSGTSGMEFRSLR